jgi:glyoxylase-like metal-dependent hydrolase (beta-lactamase superfamily II)
MRVTDHIHAIKIPFKLSVSPTRAVERFVYAYLIYGKRICLVDAGVSGSHTQIFDYVTETGRKPEEISILLFTHSHPDHIGGSRAVKGATGCKVAAHHEAKPWIEDVERQARERPITNFHSLVEGPVDVDRVLGDGDRLDLGTGLALDVVYTSGHSRGSLSFLLREDGALFSGDAIPATGGLPIYENVSASLRSIEKLKCIKGVETLLSSWHDPQRGDRVSELMDQGLAYFQKIHTEVRKVRTDSPSLGSRELCARVLGALGFPETATLPIVVTSIEAHLRELE